MRCALSALVIGLCGCGELLGADFDSPTTDDRVALSISRPTHPHQASWTGSGQVTSHDGRIDCGTACTATYRGPVTLSASADPGSAFAGWHTNPPGDCDRSRAPTCTLDVAAETAVEAFFVTHGANVWGTALGGSSRDVAYAIAADETGRAYATGCVRDTLAIGDEIWQGKGGCDIFVAAFDDAGALLRARHIRSPNDEHARDLATNGTHLVMAGDVVGTLPSESQLEPLGLWSFYANEGVVVGFDPELNVRWQMWLEGPGETILEHVAIDGDGNSYVLGLQYGALDVPGMQFEADESDLLLFAADADGVLRWGTLLGGFGAQLGVGLGVQVSGGLVVAGTTDVPADLNALGGSCPAVAPPSFIAHLSGDGACLAARSPGVSVSDLAVAGDDVILAGRFGGKLDWSNGTDPAAVLDAPTGDAVFVVRLGADLSWDPSTSFAQKITGSTKVSALAAADDGVLVALTLGSDVFVGERALGTDVGGRPAVVRLDHDGRLAWAEAYGPELPGALEDIAWLHASEAWWTAGELGAGDGSATELDFANVTQPASELLGPDAIIARFAP